MRFLKPILALIASVSALPLNAVLPVSSELPTSDQIMKYDFNSSLSENLYLGGDFAFTENYCLVPRNGDTTTGIYRGANSVNAKESDIFAIYEDDNSYIRLANFNGNSWGIDSQNTRMATYFYNNELNIPQNMPSYQTRLYFGFSYRFYCDDISKKLVNYNDPVIQLSIRGCQYAKTGALMFEDMIINEPGDKTWHTVRLPVDIEKYASGNAPTIKFFYYNIKESYTPTYYFDFDNLVLENGGKNYAYHNGDFEQYKDLILNNKTNVENAVFHNGLNFEKDFGEKAFVKNEKLMMKARNNSSTFSIHFYEKGEGIYRVAFDYSALKEKNFVMWVNGETQINLFNNGSSYYDGQKLIVYFKAKSGLKDLRFTLGETNEISIDNLEVNQVYEMNFTSGNYAEYLNNYKDFAEFKDIFVSEYVSSSAFKMKDAFEFNSHLNEYSSQEKLDQGLVYLNNAFGGAVKAGDCRSLRAYIDYLFDKIAGLNKDDFTEYSWIIFRDAIIRAQELPNDCSLFDVETALADLNTAFEGLERRQNDD